MTVAPTAEFIFKSRRIEPATGMVAGPQAPADRTAGAVAAAPAEPFRPFTAYALCWPARRKGAPLQVMTSTLSRMRSEVRDAFIAFYADKDFGRRQWAADLARGAFIARVIVSPDPGFALPKGAMR